MFAKPTTLDHFPANPPTRRRLPPRAPPAPRGKHPVGGDILSFPRASRIGPYRRNGLLSGRFRSPCGLYQPFDCLRLLWLTAHLSGPQVRLPRFRSHHVGKPAPDALGGLPPATFHCASSTPSIGLHAPPESWLREPLFFYRCNRLVLVSSGSFFRFSTQAFFYRSALFDFSRVRPYHRPRAGFE